MTDGKLQLVLQSPEQELFSGEADKIHMETETGEMEILPGHVSFIGSILFSPVTVYQGEHEYSFFVRQGMVTIINEKNKVTIVGLSCDASTAIDHKTIKEYMDFILDKLEKDQDLSEIQISYLREQKASLERLIDVIKT